MPQPTPEQLAKAAAERVVIGSEWLHKEWGEGTGADKWVEDKPDTVTAETRRMLRRLQKVHGRYTRGPKKWPA